jgi:hypothetical protein
MQLEAAYQIVVLDHAGSFLEPPVERAFRDDDEAVEFARMRLGGYVVEVWRDGRLVRRLMPWHDKLLGLRVTHH